MSFLKAEWRKFNNFEISVRVPFIIKVPWIKETQGKRTKSLVELIDIMPTLADIANITKPNDIGYPLSGNSLYPIIIPDTPFSVFLDLGYKLDFTKDEPTK